MAVGRNRIKGESLRRKKQRLRSWFYIGGSLLLFVRLSMYPSAVRLQGGTTTTTQEAYYHPQSMGNATTSHSSCQQAMDAMDDLFNKRRQVRQEATVARHSGARPGPKSLLDLFEPEATCISEERFGQGRNTSRYNAFGDGPKFVCGLDAIPTSTSTLEQPLPCLVYSIGSKNMVNFEISIKETLPHCDIHTFDPTLTEPFAGDAYATFHPWGLGIDGHAMSLDRKGGAANFTARSLVTMHQRLGHFGRTINILKIDCEGCEWKAVPILFAAIQEGTLIVDQLQLEVHARKWGERKLDQDFYDNKVKRLFAAADDAKMRIFHKERNHWGCDGYRCVEYAFVSESFLRKANARVACGGGN